MWSDSSGSAGPEAPFPFWCRSWHFIQLLMSSGRVTSLPLAWHIGSLCLLPVSPGRMWFVIRGFILLLISARQCTGDGCYDRNTSYFMIWLHVIMYDYIPISHLLCSLLQCLLMSISKIWSFQDLEFCVWACLLPTLVVFHQLFLPFCFLKELYSLISFRIVFYISFLF